MAEITIKLKVPDGMEEEVKKAVEEVVRNLLQSRKLKREVLDKYFGKFPKEIEVKEEEWYLQ